MNFDTLEIYHDAELTGIDRVGKGHVVLSFALQNGKTSRLHLHGCDFFRVTDFISQNVVSRILIFNDSGAQACGVVEKLEWSTSLTGTRSFLTKERLDNIVAKIHAGERSLFVLEPSWGAEVVALCEVILA